MPYGELAYTSLLVSAIDLRYFMSWGNDQLRLAPHRDELKALEGPLGSRRARKRTAAGLALDGRAIEEPSWRAAYFAVVCSFFVAIAAVFLTGASRG